MLHEIKYISARTAYKRVSSITSCSSMYTMLRGRDDGRRVDGTRCISDLQQYERRFFTDIHTHHFSRAKKKKKITLTLDLGAYTPGVNRPQL